jgi:8-oxo-dGTP pyrophosphatase MutT (NUDIX family)
LLGNGVIARALRLARVTLRVLWSPTDMGAVGLVIGADGRVLLVRHSYRAGWSLPGGAVDRGEPPAMAVLRELGEEVGLVGGGATLAGLYTRREGWATNVIALYRVTGGTVDFHPNWEIRDIVWADPAQPPPGATPATRRRLAELQGTAPLSPYW